MSERHDATALVNGADHDDIRTLDTSRTMSYLANDVNSNLRTSAGDSTLETQ